MKGVVLFAISTKSGKHGVCVMSDADDANEVHRMRIQGFHAMGCC